MVVYRFVVMQQMGVPEDAAWLRGGVVEVDADDLDGLPALLASIRYYLASPGLRRHIAEQGYRLFRAQPQGDALRNAVNSLLPGTP